MAEADLHLQLRSVLCSGFHTIRHRCIPNDELHTCIGCTIPYVNNENCEKNMLCGSSTQV